MTISITLTQSIWGLSELALVDDLDVEGFIFVKYFLLVNKGFGVGKTHSIYEYAALGVFGYGSLMDAYACSVGDIAYLGHHLLVSWRPSGFERVRSCGDEEVSVLDL